MLFVQPVVVDEALAERSAPAEVRIADRAAHEDLTWTGSALAQSSIDNRSPFGANAPNMNDGRPDFVPPRPVDSTPPGTSATGSGAFSDPTSTKIPPTSARPDAGPPPPGGTTMVNPDRVNDLPTPGTVAPRSTPTPGTPPSPVTPGGAGAAPGAMTPPATGSSTTIAPSGPPTLPGATSGASNTR